MDYVSDSDVNLAAMGVNLNITLMPHSLPTYDSSKDLTSAYGLPEFPLELQQSVQAVQKKLSQSPVHQGAVKFNLKACRFEDSVDSQPDESAETVSTSNTSSISMAPRFRDGADISYQRVTLSGEDVAAVILENLREACSPLITALQIRKKYIQRALMYFPTTLDSFLTGYYPEHLPRVTKAQAKSDSSVAYHPPDELLEKTPFNFDVPPSAGCFLRSDKGLVQVRLESENGPLLPELREAYTTYEEYMNDFLTLEKLFQSGPLKSFCYRRLNYLRLKFQLHVLLNDIREISEQKSVSHRDFYNIRKVDTHVHAASSMNQKHLLRFIKKKVRTEGQTVVYQKDGCPVTLNQVFDELGFTAYDLSVDLLDVHADCDTYHRFDKFNSKYNPIGQSLLRDIFLKTDNHIGGKFFSQVLKEVMSDLHESKYQFAEYRLSIYGRDRYEWDRLAEWAVNNGVHSNNVRWIIQVPRLYDIYKAKELVGSFQELIDNIFLPLFEVTNDPASHPLLHQFLFYVVGIDSVDDESKVEDVSFNRSCVTADQWTDSANPPYAYYLFYMYANLAVLNSFRRLRGMTQFSLRPHCGEAGSFNHLTVGFMVAESINHGLLLRKDPVLQYLYYLTQIGIAMSPLSNNGLFLSYQRNPLPEFLMKGLNVSLSTDDPLQFHFTKEPLMEEYSIAAQVWRLRSSDMSELARNSVLQSGFPFAMKVHWLGPNYLTEGVSSNDISRTNVPNIRVSYRYETLVDEFCTVFHGRKKSN